MERVLEITLAHPDGWRRVLPELAIERPELTAADLVAAVALAARAIEETFADADADGPAPRLYGLAAEITLAAWTLAGRAWPEARARDVATRRRPE